MRILEKNDEFITQVGQSLKVSLDNLLFKPIPAGGEISYFSEVKGHMDIIHQDYLSLLQEKEKILNVASLKVKDGFLDRPVFYNPFKASEDKRQVNKMMNQRVSLLIHIGTYTLQKVIDHFTNLKKQIEASGEMPATAIKDITHGFIPAKIPYGHAHAFVNYQQDGNYLDDNGNLIIWYPSKYAVVGQKGLINLEKLKEILGIKGNVEGRVDDPVWRRMKDAEATPVG